MRFEAPLFDCLQRGGGQNVWTTDHLQSLNDSIFIHPRVQHYRALYVALLRQQSFRMLLYPNRL
jgi:hypothetical protein